MNDKLYIHEYIDILLAGRMDYMHHMTAGWAEKIAHPERGQTCWGVWGTIDATGRWPEVINIWEHPDTFRGIARHGKFETSPPSMQDEDLATWWAKAAGMRCGGWDRLLAGAPYSHTAETMMKDPDVVGAEVFIHERVDLEPGTSKDYLGMLEQEWLPVAKDLGQHLAGAFRTVLRNDSEAILVWAVRDWSTWTKLQDTMKADARVAAWRAKSKPIVRDWISHLMFSAPLSPTRTGRQPRADDPQSH